MSQQTLKTLRGRTSFGVLVPPEIEGYDPAFRGFVERNTNEPSTNPNEGYIRNPQDARE